MRLTGGIEKWMVLLPVFALAVVVTIYVGGPQNALDLLERFVYGAWDQAAVFLRR